MKIETDVVIIGSGVAALQAARKLADYFQVHIVTKAKMINGSSYKAQGGIAAVTSHDDSSALHVMDTLNAGEHHHEIDNVKSLVKEGQHIISNLIQENFQVDRTISGDISLGLEGAHSKPRILHSGGDATGRALIHYLIEALPSKVQIHEFELAYELLLNTSGECIGVKTKSKTEDHIYLASYVILATGGAGAIYACTSNCADSFGDGIALSYLAGAQIADMEFVQFHPSLLFVNGESQGLVSEAVRGAGGYFVDENGRKIMKGIHPLEDLAPRHVTAYEMYKERVKGKEVYIDISKISRFTEKFPTISNLCKKNGVDLSKGRIPIAPGSHFLMGGVIADCYGNTTIPRLLAVGEVACTGVHGANRLASNSLLEGITFGKLMAKNLISNGTRQKNFQLQAKKDSSNSLRLYSKEFLQQQMLENAGILRDSKGLTKLVDMLPIKQFQSVNLNHLSREQIELIFMHITASLVAHACFFRKESRGAHIRVDYPEKSEDWQHKWIVFEKGKMKARDGLYEQHQTSDYVTSIF